MLSYSQFSMLRRIVLGLSGLVCLLYAVLALIMRNPAPISPWLPWMSGALGLFVIFAAARLAGPDQVRRAKDELFRHDAQTAQRVGFWVALSLYPIFAIPLSLDMIAWPVAFAAMGTLSAAAFLLSFVWFDMRGG
ncbi:hypothetical protein FGG78_10645 [Thioclava sp. BHET1]|nr:hypothetical protein FGG78_10645 [Thioclava sp. BHET1]